MTDIDAIRDRDRLWARAKCLMPRHFLATAAHSLVNTESRFIRDLLFRIFLNQHRVNMDEAVVEDIHDYPSFNAFFTRALKPGARKVCADDSALAAAVDGSLTRQGLFAEDHRFRAKGTDFSLPSLLGINTEQNTRDRQLLEDFRGGYCCIQYLAPGDYHRVHMPVSGDIIRARYIPGKLFSVNAITRSLIPDIHARNERLVNVFDTALGPMILIMVGAGFVSGIETRWTGSGLRGLSHTREIPLDTCQARHFAKGDEIGRFSMGSTVIVLMGGKEGRWQSAVETGRHVKMGQALAYRRAS